MIAPDDLSLSDGEVLDILGRGELELLGLLPRSSNYTFLVRVRDGRDELLAVYKPKAGEAPLWDFPDGTLHRREAAAYVLSRALGWPRIPPTLVREGPHGVGSLQRFLRFDADEHYFTLQDDPDREPVLRRVAVFDALANNADRKAGHCLLAEDGELFFVDHGVCFAEQPKLRTVIWAHAGQPLPQDVLGDLERLRSDLATGPLRAELGALLAPREVAALEERLVALLGSRSFPQPGAERPYPWPPV